MGGTANVTLRRHVVIVGGGFGGLAAARALADEAVEVTVVDRTNHHLFQPLLYQVAIAGLSPAEIAAPLRSILASQAHTRVLLDEVLAVDPTARVVELREGGRLAWDFLVLAPGATTSWFGKAEWPRLAPGLKDLDDAVEIRRRVLVAFEQAEREGAGPGRDRLLSFVVIGGGPTGVELAGAIAELAATALEKDFRVIHPDLCRVVLVEAGPRLLAAMDPRCSEAAAKALASLGVEVNLDTRVTEIREDGVQLGDRWLPTRTVLWAAGVRASPLLQTLGVPLDAQGRVAVEADLSLPGHPELFVLGDAARLDVGGLPLPGVSPVAMQQGRYVGRRLRDRLQGRSTPPFRYVDKGSMATIGRNLAVAQLGGRTFSGRFAWMLWLLVHIHYLIDFRNRIAVLLQWAWAWLFFRRGARLITGHRLEAGAPKRPGA